MTLTKEFMFGLLLVASIGVLCLYLWNEPNYLSIVSYLSSQVQIQNIFQANNAEKSPTKTTSRRQTGGLSGGPPASHRVTVGPPVAISSPPKACCLGRTNEKSEKENEKTPERKNILLIIADDMRTDLGVYKDIMPEEDSIIQTPSLDNLARRSLLLKEAHVQQAICSPSRASFLTSRRPDTTRVYDLETNFRDSGGDFVTLPQYFKENGYKTVGLGKVFHESKAASGKDQDAVKSWTFMDQNFEGLEVYKDGIAYGNFTRHQVVKDFGKDVNEELITNEGAKYIKELGRNWKEKKENFLLAVGFRRPHLPFIVPEEFLKMYPIETTPVAKHRYPPVHMAPIHWHAYHELRNYKHFTNFTGAPNSAFPLHIQKELRRHYFAAITWVDSLIGRLLATLDADQEVRRSTIVAFLGDHGWQFGEHAMWCKSTNFDITTRAPLMVSIPGLTDKGINITSPTEFVDLFPSLVEAAGLPSLQQCPLNSSKVQLCTEGQSLLPLVKHTNQRYKKNVAFSQFPRGNNVMGYSIRTPRYRYTEWIRYHWSGNDNAPKYVKYWKISFGIELYDHQFDQWENVNVANATAYKQVSSVLSELLRAGWTKAGNFVEDVEKLEPKESPHVIQSYVNNVTESMLMRTNQ